MALFALQPRKASLQSNAGVRSANLLDISRSRRLSPTTIRSHSASLFVKTQTRWQA